jgi:hypothetical protein
MSLSWTQPTCEKCWIADHMVLPLDANGYPVAIEAPVMVRNADLEHCSYCGGLTFIGVYTRADPTTVLYPREKDD